LKGQGDWSTQLRFNWCRFSGTGNVMPFDFGCNKILIELDGAQHFTQVSNWDSPETVQAKDIEKITKSVREGFSIIHIYQVDIWADKYDWKDVLEREIKRLSEAEAQCSFISQGQIYETHISKLDTSIKYTTQHPTSS
jgi:very-short-patch-repair endonuclease